MIASAQITNTDIFAFTAILAFKLWSRKVLFINRKGNRNCEKYASFYKNNEFYGQITEKL